MSEQALEHLRQLIHCVEFWWAVIIVSGLLFVIVEGIEYRRRKRKERIPYRHERWETILCPPMTDEQAERLKKAMDDQWTGNGKERMQ